MKFTPKILFLISFVVSFVVATELLWVFFPRQKVDLQPPVVIEWEDAETQDQVAQPPS